MDVGAGGERSVQVGPARRDRGADAQALLSALHGIALLSARAQELAPALGEALRTLCDAAGFAAGHALVLSEGRLSSARVFYGVNENLRKACERPVFAPGQGLPGRVLERSASLWAAGFEGDPRAAAALESGLRSALVCPILAGQQVAGVLELFSTAADRPDPLVIIAAEQAAAQLGRVKEREPAERRVQRREEVRGFVSMVEDLGAQRDAQEALRASEDRFRAIFEEAGVGIAIGTPEGVLVRANRALGRFLGRAPEELTGRTLHEMVHGDDIPATANRLREVQSGETSVFDLEKRYLRSDGTTVWGRTTVTRLGNTGLLIGIVQDIDARKHAEEAVRSLSGRLLHLQDDERRRIARALHESAAQTVAALSMNLQRMERMQLAPHAAEALADSLELVTQCSREIRTLSHLLHPPLLEEAGLPSSLRWYVQGFAARSNVEVELKVSDDLGRLPMELEITLFRVVQESLTNVHRHSGSSSASIRLWRSGPEVVLEVEDRGIGVPRDKLAWVKTQMPAAVGVGIAGMRERLSQLGGTLEIESGPRGTLVRARLRSER
jgi:PAS domain S-box-containing protein